MARGYKSVAAAGYRPRELLYTSRRSAALSAMSTIKLYHGGRPSIVDIIMSHVIIRAGLNCSNNPRVVSDFICVFLFVDGW